METRYDAGALRYMKNSSHTPDHMDFFPVFGVPGYLARTQVNPRTVSNIAIEVAYTIGLIAYNVEFFHLAHELFK